MKIISFDQATKITGYAVYEDGTLTRYGTLHATGDDYFARMRQMYMQVCRLLDAEAPHLVSFEGTQFQQNYKVYSELSQMQGVLFAACFARSMPFRVVVPTVWKAYCGVKGRKRDEQKRSAMTIVASDGIIAPEDACEAILQGKYVVENTKG